MKISIVTATYNSEKTISDTIKSVNLQSYDNVEHIIIDGGSTDNTLGVIQSLPSRVSQVISEQDNGIYDAMNKGIKLATGDVIGILNSDDFYKSNDILEIVAREFMDNNIDCLYADLEYVSAENPMKVVRYWKSKSYKNGMFQKGWHPAHPTFFIKRECYKKYGSFNLDFRIAADYEIMLRFLEKYKLKSSYINKTFVCMRVGGESNRNILNIIKANIESYNAWKVNGLWISPVVFLLKPLSKVLQFIRKGK